MLLNLDIKKGFGSDNHAPTHPEILESILAVNQGHVPSYGTDQVSTQAVRLFQKIFASPCQVYFVYNGTGANVLSLASLTSSYNSVIVSTESHLNMDECGAPEVIGGCKLIPLACHDAKLDFNLVKAQLRRWGDQHFAQPKVISITQPTEVGTLYEVDEIKSLAELAHSNNMWLHIDGARLIVAAQALNVSLADLTTHLGVDVVSFGGTKNGLMFGEAVIFLNPACHNSGVKFLRKQLLQLPSKTRYIAAQFNALLESDLWQRIADHEIRCARTMAEHLAKIPGVKITHPVQANAVFAVFPKRIIRPLRQDYFFYVWDESISEVRLMMSFDTTFEEIEKFCQQVQKLIEQET